MPDLAAHDHADRVAFGAGVVLQRVVTAVAGVRRRDLDEAAHGFTVTVIAWIASSFEDRRSILARCCAPMDSK